MMLSFCMHSRPNMGGPNLITKKSQLKGFSCASARGIVHVLQIGSVIDNGLKKNGVSMYKFHIVKGLLYYS